MAPRKPTATAKPAKKGIASQSKNVVKRPVRGYHKYKNGLLNVTPKGDEKDLFKNNQHSPLLRLPPEIRNRIWEYTLGNIVFRVRGKRSGRKYSMDFVPPSNEPSIGVSLLRTCCQIYSEAASMPIRLNTFAFLSTWAVKKVTKQLKPYQRKQINTIRLEAYSPDDHKLTHLWQMSSSISIYPAVKTFQFIVHGGAGQEKSITLKDIETQFREDHATLLDDAGIGLIVEEGDGLMPDSWFSVLG
ncbi:uncharacterized protein M421DRAFT_403295 [Didymella exigua CBS 183.55]|uniref:DUF7730 domain-containing protein n=1 Tax=Didymella exigua CBS 183.55 TaxID=1150837 RepID=A0A6A5S1R1_9PLEO|nr:uncharacterized protein M421DRAFT_403295 [Didymella exigua CBS 183.55]KAF1932426.1 hypothetical protein M421DRAFT_403295 [Didymella exigua CBS 183.55]